MEHLPFSPRAPLKRKREEVVQTADVVRISELVNSIQRSPNRTWNSTSTETFNTPPEVQSQKHTNSKTRHGLSVTMKRQLRSWLRHSISSIVCACNHFQPQNFLLNSIMDEVFSEINMLRSVISTNRTLRPSHTGAIVLKDHSW